MFQAKARWLLLAGLPIGALIACGGDDPATGGGGAGTSSGGSSAGSQVGGSGGSPTTSGSNSGGNAGTATGGNAGTGTAAGSGGSAGSGGTGGASGGAGGGGGSGGAGGPTAVANITGVNGMTVTGKATFVQGATMTTVTVDLSACPNGDLVSHLHEFKMCGNNANDAGVHWVPNGEKLGNYKCEGGKATHTAMKPIGEWTVGDGGATDVSKYSFVVHSGTDPTPGMRIGCGLIDKL